MKTRIIFIILVILLVGAGWFFSGNELVTSEGQKKIEEPQGPQYKITKYEIGEEDTFAVVMEKLGFDYVETMDILNLASSTYDFTSVRIGQPLRIYHDDLGNFVKLEYEPNKEEIAVVSFVSSTYQAEMVDIEYDITTDVAGGTIEESLWLAGLEAGMEDALIIEFADVFAWTVDFAIEVRTGDTFKVLYEKRHRDGKYIGIGKVLAGQFVNSGKESRGYLFEDVDGKPAYYSEKGEAMIKQFLKAPLKYKYISSGYTYARFHPVTQRNTPHLAIDYAASIGTPVMAVGDGTVTSAGWNGGFGNYIDIHHNSTYSTQYAHLSAYAKGITRGAKVTQGQVIGYVGSTGWSTGPHLHYQIKKFGSLVNPLTIELPPGEPVAEEKQAEFANVKNKFDKMMGF